MSVFNPWLRSFLSEKKNPQSTLINSSMQNDSSKRQQQTCTAAWIRSKTSQTKKKWLYTAIDCQKQLTPAKKPLEFPCGSHNPRICHKQPLSEIISQKGNINELFLRTQNFSLVKKTRLIRSKSPGGIYSELIIV